MIKDSNNGYGLISRTFHWVMAIMMIGTVTWGYLFTEKIVDLFMDRGFAFYLHRTAGLVIFTLVIVRIIWRLTQPTPPLDHVPTWQRLAAKLNIIFLYVAMVGFPVSGVLMGWYAGYEQSYFSLFTLPAIEKNPVIAGFFNSTHKFFFYAILASFSVHVLGAFYHHFGRRDNVLTRMWSGQ